MSIQKLIDRFSETVRDVEEDYEVACALTDFIEYMNEKYPKLDVESQLGEFLKERTDDCSDEEDESEFYLDEIGEEEYDDMEQEFGKEFDDEEEE